MSEKITKAALVDTIAAQTNLSKKEANQVLDVIGQAIQDVLVAGNEMVLPGLGTISTTNVKEKQGVNPSTREAITIAAHKKVKVTITKPLKDAVKNS